MTQENQNPEINKDNHLENMEQPPQKRGRPKKTNEAVQADNNVENTSQTQNHSNYSNSAAVETKETENNANHHDNSDNDDNVNPTGATQTTEMNETTEENGDDSVENKSDEAVNHVENSTENKPIQIPVVDWNKVIGAERLPDGSMRIKDEIYTSNQGYTIPNLQAKSGVLGTFPFSVTLVNRTMMMLPFSTLNPSSIAPNSEVKVSFDSVHHLNAFYQTLIHFAKSYQFNSNKGVFFK